MLNDLDSMMKSREAIKLFDVMRELGFQWFHVHIKHCIASKDEGQKFIFHFGKVCRM